MMKKKMTLFIPYAVVLGLDFYIFPCLIKDTGSAMFMLLCVIPLIAFICSVVYGIRQGFDGVMPVAAVILFLPTIFIYYNTTAYVYVFIYGIITFVGNGIGRLFYKKCQSVS